MKRLILTSLLVAASSTVSAMTLSAPDLPGDGLIGSPPENPHYVIAKQEDTLIDIAVEHHLGQDHIVLANPNVDRWLPGAGTQVRIPNGFVLPDAARQGVIINLPEMRLYYFPDAQKVITYSIGIGRVDWKTPMGKTRIQDKQANPSWTPPPSIIAEHLADGDKLDPYYPPGPDNPLGLFAFKLGIPGYLIHSTNKVNGVGMRVSHGCIRMYPLDIEKFFPMIKVGTEVNIVNQSVKVGWYHNTLYVEVYPEMEETPASFEDRLHHALDLIAKVNGGKMPVIKASVLRDAIGQARGLPVPIYQRSAATPTPAATK